MNCHEAIEALVAQLDRELPADEVRRLEAHLAGCAACARERRQQEALWRLLDLAAPIEPAAGLAARVRAQAAGAAAGAPAAAAGAGGTAGRVRFLSGARRWAAGLAAAAALLLVVGTLVWRGSGTGPELTAEEAEAVENLDLIEDMEVAATLDMLESTASVEELTQILDGGEEVFR